MRKIQLIDEALKIKNEGIAASISRGHAPDDIKSASVIYIWG